MENWRKDQGISNHQVGHWRSSSHSEKPHLDNQNMNMHSNVMNWVDYAVKEAFDDEKFRFWAENNGFPGNIPLPDPNMYVNDPHHNQDLDREVEARHNMKKRGHEDLIIDSSHRLKQSFTGLGWGLGPTGWEDDNKGVIKSPEPSYVAEGWRSKEYTGGELHDMYQAGNSGNRNWGTWEANNKSTENSMPWSKNDAYQHDNIEDIGFVIEVL
ncbi:uncharacterized protein LOC131614871 [Vicia villosa]|uniref:uncharacterized protein LOC131614871 n=1 Tax=Vicia villosa TaxID=3911 RepID=UPI00273B6F83|nr:uncharacterized protein LOC131614871 [Vicia villosa]